MTRALITTTVAFVVLTCLLLFQSHFEQKKLRNHLCEVSIQKVAIPNCK